MNSTVAAVPGSLAGLSVDQWLTTLAEPAVAGPLPFDEPVAFDGPASPMSVTPGRRATRGAFAAATWLTGLGLGLLLALPLPDVTSSCPPKGEGLVDCQLHHAVLPAVMTALGVCFAFVLAVRVLAALPSLVARLRSGSVLAPPPAPMPADDPLLVRASGGFVYRTSRRGPTATWRPRWEHVGV